MSKRVNMLIELQFNEVDNVYILTSTNLDLGNFVEECYEYNTKEEAEEGLDNMEQNLEDDGCKVQIKNHVGLDAKIKELLEKEFLTNEELNKILKSNQIMHCERGNSGKNIGCTWYSLVAINNEEYDVYSTSEDI